MVGYIFRNMLFQSEEAAILGNKAQSRVSMATSYYDFVRS